MISNADNARDRTIWIGAWAYTSSDTSKCLASDHTVSPLASVWAWAEALRTTNRVNESIAAQLSAPQTAQWLEEDGEQVRSLVWLLFPCEQFWEPSMHWLPTQLSSITSEKSSMHRLSPKAKLELSATTIYVAGQGCSLDSPVIHFLIYCIHR